MKKNVFKMTFLLCLAALTVTLLCGCAKESPADTTVATPTAEQETTTATETTINPALLPLVAEGEAIYKVIRSEESSEAELRTAMALREYLGEAGGLSYPLETDWIRRGGDPDTVSEYEILVGDTNRSASAEGLGEIKGDTWCVTIVGNRIVLNASNGLLLEEALTYFESLCTVVDGILMLDTSRLKVEVVPNPLLDADITLRVGSYNIKNGSGVNHDMSILAADIKELDLDIIGLQEVDIGTSRAKGLDTLKLLAEATGYSYYQFTKAISFSGGEYGTAILSRYPIVNHESVLLATPSGYEQRAYGHAIIDVNGVNIHFFNTHLSYEKKDIRAAQLAELAAATAVSRGYILTADFNTADLNEFKVFEDSIYANNGKYATFPSSSSAIDNIILESGWRIVDSGMVASNKSDHNMLWAEIHYEG